MLHANAPSAADRVYGEVKELILTNEIAGGELISEGEVAGRCEVSRTPVREAFLRLQAEGWMRLYPKRGALVLPVTEREARDVVDARRLLEGHAVRAVGDATAAALAVDLRDNLDRHRLVPADDIADFARIDAQFHQLIVAAGDNELLAGFFTGLGERHRRMTTASVHRDPRIAARILADHAELLELIAQRDTDGFDAALARHLDAVHNVGAAHTRTGGDR
ncbi:GntR family transcriptional regulator [Gordonia sp. VNQ95]|jgi:DNA-binding GntR family transcriptional regulator|uniref:GntR family transcriptional regulator n=1 Tax=Gordonia TaxID=2053 RepID=UPI0032B3BA24